MELLIALFVVGVAAAGIFGFLAYAFITILRG